MGRSVAGNLKLKDKAIGWFLYCDNEEPTGRHRDSRNVMLSQRTDSNIVEVTIIIDVSC